MRCDLRSVCLRRVTKSVAFMLFSCVRDPVARFTTFLHQKGTALSSTIKYVRPRPRDRAATRGAGGAGSGVLYVRL